VVGRTNRVGHQGLDLPRSLSSPQRPGDCPPPCPVKTSKVVHVDKLPLADMDSLATSSHKDDFGAAYFGMLLSKFQ